MNGQLDSVSGASCWGYSRVSFVSRNLKCLFLKKLDQVSFDVVVILLLVIIAVVLVVLIVVHVVVGFWLHLHVIGVSGVLRPLVALGYH